jgi:hypothetical protein
MREVRAMTYRDINAMARVIAEEHQARELAMKKARRR